MMRRSLSTLTRATAAATLIAGAGLAAPTAHHAQANAGHSAVDTATTDPRFGIDQIADHNAAVSADYLSSLADQMGARWTRIPFIWRYLQPNAPTHSDALTPVAAGTLPAPAAWPSGWNPFALDAGGTDAAIDRELTHRRDIVGLLLGTPAWACRDTAKASRGTCGTGDVPTLTDASGKLLSWSDPLNTWGAYCYQMARHFGPDTAHPQGRINEWTIWNEVSIPGGSSWTQWNDPNKAQSEQDYAYLVEVAYQAIKAANPAAKVVLYGDPYWYDQGAFLSGVLDQLKHDDPDGTHNGYFDVANLHLYIGTPSFYWIITNLREQLRRHGWANKQVWVSETNVEPYDDTTRGAGAARNGTTAFRVTQQEQAGFLVDAFATYIAAKADRFAIFRMFDGSGMTSPNAAPLGVVNDARVERPFGYSFSFLAKVFKNAQPAVDTVAYHAGEFYPDRTLDGQPVYKAGVFKVVSEKLDNNKRPTERITTVWNQFGALNPAVEKHYTKVTYAWDHSLHYNYNKTDHLYHDAKDMIVLPTTDARGRRAADWAGVSYDAYGSATYTFKAAAGVTTATVYDKYGHATRIHDGDKPVEIDNLNWNGQPLSYVTKATEMTIQLSHGAYTVTLRGGTTYSNPADPRIPTVGGDPVVVVEQMGNNNR